MRLFRDFFFQKNIYVFLLKEYEIAKRPGTRSVVYVLMAWLKEPISRYFFPP
jgi:hypothetical protein